MFFDFDNKITEFLKIIVESANQQNISIYIVGGAVRDNILNISVKDIDLIVESNALEFVNFLPNSVKVKSLHSDFYTAKVEYKNIVFDIASTRLEHYPYSGCLPVVDRIGVDIGKDYLRRDFTVNSLYCKLGIENNNLTYDLIDIAGGKEDIKNKTLKVLHPKSYIDDPTRIIRGIDFKYRFGFDFSKQDKKLIDYCIKNLDISNGSADRLLSVFAKVLSGKNNRLVFQEIYNNKYYKIINNIDLDIDFVLLDKTLTNFKINNYGDFYLKIIENKNIEKIDYDNILILNRILNTYSDAEIAYYYYKTYDENAITCLGLKDIKTLLNGNDLIKLGYPQNKIIGNILDKLLLFKYQNPKNIKNKEDELEWVKNNFPYSR